jgi:hypothetical protein
MLNENEESTSGGKLWSFPHDCAPRSLAAKGNRNSRTGRKKEGIPSNIQKEAWSIFRYLQDSSLQEYSYNKN